MKILVIAHNTFRETIRDKILRVIIGLCFLIIVASRAIAEISLGQDLKVIADLSMGAIDTFGMVLCVFIGTGLIYKEIDKQTLYTVLARPLSRWQFILGKYIGMAATLAVSVGLMASVFCAFYWLSGGKLHPTMLICIFMLFLGLMLLNAIAVFFSTMASPTVSAICTIAIFIVGRATFELKFLAEISTGIKQQLVMALYYVLPNFYNFSSIKQAATHQIALENPWGLMLGSLGYCVVYSFFLLYMSSLVFSKRNL